MEQQPDAASTCHNFQRYYVASVGLSALVGINLPEHEKITGFIFGAPILPEAVQSNLLTLLNADGAMGGCQDPAALAQFDAEVDKLYTALHTGTADPAVMTLYQQFLQLAHSIHLPS